MSEKNSINIKIMGRDYQIACGPDEEDALRQSATYLNKQMEKINFVNYFQFNVLFEKLYCKPNHFFEVKISPYSL